MIGLLRSLRRLLAGLLIIGVATGIAWSFAANNNVEASHAGDMLVDAPPPAVSTPTPTPTPTPPSIPNIPLVCTSLNLTNSSVITGNGAIHGTDQNDLIIGSLGKDNIHAGVGNDCIVGNGGGDQIFGDDGFDICIAGLLDLRVKFHDCEVEVW